MSKKVSSAIVGDIWVGVVAIGSSGTEGLEITYHISCIRKKIERQLTVASSLANQWFGS